MNSTALYMLILSKFSNSLAICLQVCLFVPWFAYLSELADRDGLSEDDRVQVRVKKGVYASFSDVLIFRRFGESFLDTKVKQPFVSGTLKLAYRRMYNFLASIHYELCSYNVF